MVQFILIAGLILGFYLYPGSIDIIWFNYKIHLSIGVFLSLIFLAFVLISLVLKLCRMIWQLPNRLSNKYRSQRFHQAQDSLKTALAKYQNMDFKKARQTLEEALRNKETDYFAHYLASQIAFKQQDFEAQEYHLEELIKLSGGQTLGYTNLIALKRGQVQGSELLKWADKAQPFMAEAPVLAEHLFEIYLHQSGPQKAREILDRLKRQKTVSKEQEQILEGELEKNEAEQALKNQEFSIALKKSEKAYEKNPIFDTLRLYVTLLLSLKYEKKAEKVLEQAWSQRPDSKIIDLYKKIDEMTSPLIQFQRIEKLTQSQASHPESLLAKAQSALDAQLWGLALNFLQEYETKYEATTRFLSLKARYEQLANHDIEAALKWLGKEVSTASKEDKKTESSSLPYSRLLS